MFVSFMFLAFCPYHIGRFTVIGVKVEDMVREIHFFKMPNIITISKTNLASFPLLFTTLVTAPSPNASKDYLLTS